MRDKCSLLPCCSHWNNGPDCWYFKSCKEDKKLGRPPFDKPAKSDADVKKIVNSV